jgi:hypothetical protein
MLKRKRKRELSSQDSTPISAMIDIVFLLLIYFILTQKPIIEDTRLNFSPARRGKSAAQSSAISDFAFLEINENTETYLFNGQAISREQLPTYLNHIGKNNKETQLIIFCADNVKHADLVKALDLCRLSSLSNISIMAK